MPAKVRRDTVRAVWHAALVGMLVSLVPTDTLAAPPPGFSARGIDHSPIAACNSARRAVAASIRADLHQSCRRIWSETSKGAGAGFQEQYDCELQQTVDYRHAHLIRCEPADRDGGRFEVTASLDVPAALLANREEEAQIDAGLSDRLRVLRHALDTRRWEDLAGACASTLTEAVQRIDDLRLERGVLTGRRPTLISPDLRSIRQRTAVMRREPWQVHAVAPTPALGAALDSSLRGHWPWPMAHDSTATGTQFVTATITLLEHVDDGLTWAGARLSLTARSDSGSDGFAQSVLMWQPGVEVADARRRLLSHIASELPAVVERFAGDFTCTRGIDGKRATVDDPTVLIVILTKGEIVAADARRIREHAEQAWPQGAGRADSADSADRVLSVRVQRLAEGWATQAALFDTETRRQLGRDTSECSGCALTGHLVDYPSLLARVTGLPGPAPATGLWHLAGQAVHVRGPRPLADTVREALQRAGGRLASDGAVGGPVLTIGRTCDDLGSHRTGQFVAAVCDVWLEFTAAGHEPVTQRSRATAQHLNTRQARESASARATRQAIVGLNRSMGRQAQSD